MLLRLAADAGNGALFAQDRVAEALDIGEGCRQDLMLRHVQHGQGLDVQLFAVAFKVDLVPGLHFLPLKMPWPVNSATFLLLM